MGMAVGPGDVCFRANFATVEPTPGGLRLLDRRAGRIASGQADLARALNGIRLVEEPGITLEFLPSTQHRGAFILRGEGLSWRVGETDPHEVGAMVPDAHPLQWDDAAARRTATAVNEFTRKCVEVLEAHPVNRSRAKDGKPPANVLLLRGASRLPHLQPIQALYGVRGAVIAGGALYRGVALACGMERVDAPGATGGVDTDLRSKAETALSALERLDYVFLHVKGTDNAAHDKDARAKTAFIERLDAELFGRLLKGIDWKTTHLAFTGDHTTPVDYGDHTAEPVPVLFAGPNVLSDRVAGFSEREAAHGGLDRFSGRVLPMLFNYNNWNPKFGS
jgi:2,3-bisphosphoglycerate-independent phosphoglycerate mutase